MTVLRNHWPVIVIGAGVAGMQTALEVAERFDVLLVSRSPWDSSNSGRAQGGIAVALASGDSPERHAADTLFVGRGICDRQAVDVLVGQAAAATRPLLDRGVFERTEHGPKMGLEAGHQYSRILHAPDSLTGKAVCKDLGQRVRDNPRIHFVSARLMALITNRGRCSGVWLDIPGEGILPHWAPHTVLATGGYAGLYQTTSNPRVTNGEGLWLAYGAGAVVRDLEFIQFHPTVLRDDEVDSPLLLTEALRGAGAWIVDASGRRILNHHPQKELAPRDEVARAVFQAVKETGQAYLTLQHLDPSVIEGRFSGLVNLVRERGYELTQDLLPISVGAHFTMGGILTDLDGRTTVPGLYAVGEVASTGVHGANRLASNSLLEGLVFGERLGRLLRSSWIEPVTEWSDDSPQVGPNFPSGLGEVLDQYLGVVRTREGLEKGEEQLGRWEKPRFPGLELVELAFRAAAIREESRGGHWRADYPEPEPNWQGHLYHQRDYGCWYEPIPVQRWIPV